MRYLMILCLSLCAGTLGCLFPEFSGLLPFFALGCLVLFLIFLIFFRKKETRLMLVFLGLGIGLLLGWNYDRTVFTPTRQYVGTTMTVTGEATDYSVETSYGIRFDGKLFLPDGAVKATVWLYSDESLKPGDKFTANVRLEDSGSEDSYYNYASGVYLSAYGKEDAVIEPCARIPARYYPKYLAHKLEQALKNAFPADTYGLAAALTTGNRDDLTAISKANLKASGIYHAVALSGMHLAVLLSMLNLLVLKRKRLRAILGIPIAVCFTILTGCTPSMVRATVMQCLILSADLVRREKDWQTSLSLALAVLMMENPWSIMNWGLQLSFLSVIGIELFSVRLHDFFMRNTTRAKPIRYKLRNLIASSFAATFSAMVMTLPLMALYFGFISLVSPITNLLTSTVISFCFGGSLLTALAGPILPGVGHIMGWVLSWGFRYVDFIAETMAGLPFSQLYTNNFCSILWLILLFVLIFLLARRGTRKIIPICCAVSALAVCTFFPLLEDRAPSLTALDVGQGQCLLLQTKSGNTLMIDCGGNQGNAGDIAADHLSSKGKTTLDILVLTHYDSDHVGGVEELLYRIPVKKLLLPDMEHEKRDTLTALAEKTGTEVIPVSTETIITMDQDTVHVFAPLTVGDQNESGLSLLASMGIIDLLVTGDMETDTELRLLGQHDIPDVDILVAGHHGSRTSTGEALLNATQPDYVVISVGENSYGHPHKDALERITAVNATIYRTDEQGTITIKGE